MKNLLLVLAVLSVCASRAQPNCHIYSENDPKRKACELSHEAIKYQQGSRASQELFDAAIATAPDFAWAYYEKSVPYFKRGFLHKGLQILNKAVDLSPLDYLCYRAYWYWQYRNYELCIDDLETYYALPKAYYQTTPGGEKDMRIILGLAYSKIGNFKKGIEVINNCMSTYETEIDFGYADYLSLGILYFFNTEYDKAESALKEQLSIIENTAEVYYFMGLIHLKKENIRKAKLNFKKAKEVFADPNRFRNINGGFRVYEQDVDEELQKLTALENSNKT